MHDRIRTLARRAWAGDLLALLAGINFPLAFAPFDWSLVGIVCIFTLLVSLTNASTARGVWRFYLFAVGMYGVGVSWIYVSIHRYGGASPVLAALLVAGFVLAFSTISILHGWLYMRFVRPLPLAVMLGFPALWVIQEWFRTWILTGFPWLLAGYAHLSTPLAGYAPVFGVMGVSLVVVATAALLYELLWQRKGGRVAGIAGAVILIWGVGYAFSKVEWVEPFGEPVTVSAVQGNIDQATKWQRDMVMPIVRLYTDLTREEWGRDLIVWPEAAVTLFRENASAFLARLDRKGEAEGSTVVLGIPDRDAGNNFYNTAVAVGEGEGSYRKRRLVPFGEYVPLEDQLRGAIRFFDLPMSHNRPGPEDQQPLVAGSLELSLSICYEVVYPELVRETVDNPDLLVTISNDTWFGDSLGPSQHLQMARMRALENGRYMIRATNNGITAIVDEKGKVTASLPRFETGVLRGEARTLAGTTPYGVWGSWPVLAFVFAGLAALWAYRRWFG